MQPGRRKFCAAFKPRSEETQSNAIGFNSTRRSLQDMNLYKSPPNCDALCKCLDPSGGEWEDIEPPEPNEWLDAMLDKTPDQSFRDFVNSRPNQPDVTRRFIYLQPICEPGELEGPAFPAGPWPSWQALEAAVTCFYAPLPVRTLPPLPMTKLSPVPASRLNHCGKQYHASEVLNALRGVLPRDAYCLLAVTMWDLYPREEWNFVYGLANLTSRTGVFSFVRHTPAHGSDEWRESTMLHRSMKTMLHEIGHMFGMKHCTWYNCLMRGSNGEQVEHQKNFLHLCPVCLRKLHWSVGFDVVERYRRLLELYQEHESSSEFFARDCAFLRSRLEALADLPPGATMMSELAAWGRRGTTAAKGSAQKGVGRGAPGSVRSSSATVLRAGRNIAVNASYGSPRAIVAPSANSRQTIRSASGQDIPPASGAVRRVTSVAGCRPTSSGSGDRRIRAPNGMDPIRPLVRITS